MLSLDPKTCIEKVKNGQLSPFSYLNNANKLLSSPKDNSTGREYIIRALDTLHTFEKQSELLKNLVRKAGLYPYLKKYFPLEKSQDVELLLSLYQSAVNPDFIFHSMQAKIFNLLITGRNVVLSAPTSMGKSAIIDSLIASKKFNKIVIVVPTIALIDETRRRVQNIFGNKIQVIYHGSQEIKKDKAVYILTQERVNERDDLHNIDLFVVDEFYKLAFNQEEKSRAIALNIAVSKLATVSKQFYMIGPYIDAVRGIDTLGKEYVFIPTDFNVVALNINKYNIKANNLEEKNSKVKEILNIHTGQTIIYCKSQSSIDKVVSSLDYLLFENISHEVENYYDWLIKNYGRNWCYTKALKLGIGVHHGALPRALQQKTVDLFNRKKIKYLVCTSTLIEGVNTVAENVIIYDNRRAISSIDVFTYKNISGRAGRMNIHLIGNVFCLEGLPKKELESNIVDLPLSQQDEDTPLNLLFGLQSEHLTDLGNEYLSSYKASAYVPLEIIKNHSSYSPEIINEAYKYITEMSIIKINDLSTMKIPEGYCLDLFITFIKTVEYGSLQKLNIHYHDNDDLKNRINWYIYAGSHTDYIQDRLNYIYKNPNQSLDHSDATDKELKIIRNIFKHSIPRATMLFQDLLNHELEFRGIDKRADFGYLTHTFENSHLPSAFSALEEMGVAVETLEKIVTERLRSANIETLSRYILTHYKNCKKIDYIDKMFIKLALKQA